MAKTGKPFRGSIMLHKATFRSDEVDRNPFFPWVVRVDIWGEPWIWHIQHKPTKRNIRKFIKLSINEFLQFHGDPIEYASDENYALEG